MKIPNPPLIKDVDGSDSGVETKEDMYTMNNINEEVSSLSKNINEDVSSVPKNINEEVSSLPKKRDVIKIKRSEQKNGGKDLNNLQADPQETKPTIEAEANSTLAKPIEVPQEIKSTIEANADSTLVKPTSQEAVVKGDQSNKMKQDLEDEKLRLKLEATKKKLHKSYQQAEDSKKRTQLVEYKDVPKQELYDDAGNKKPKNRRMR